MFLLWTIEGLSGAEGVAREGRDTLDHPGSKSAGMVPGSSLFT